MNEMTTLANIERRITFHMQGAYANILEVGRCLIEAKDSGLVQHGEWEEWVQRTTGMSERTAQRLMQAAREVSPESAMAKLPITKITAILSLPEGQREAVAEKAVAENQSLRELQATIDEMKRTLSATQSEAARAAMERDNAAKVVENVSRSRNELRSEVGRLRAELEAAKARPAEGISPEAQRRIDSLGSLYTEVSEQCDALKARLEEAEKMAEYQAEQRQAAQRELTELRSQAARGDAAPVEDLTAESVGLAVRTFMGTVGFLPHSDRLVTMRYQDRQQVQAFARMIGKWASDVQKTLGCVTEAIVIEGVGHE